MLQTIHQMDWQPIVALGLLGLVVLVVTCAIIKMSIQQWMLNKMIEESNAGARRVAEHHAKQGDYRGRVLGQGTEGIPKIFGGTGPKDLSAAQLQQQQDEEEDRRLDADERRWRLKQEREGKAAK